MIKLGIVIVQRGTGMELKIDPFCMGSNGTELGPIAVGDDFPAVVCSSADDIQFIAAAWTVLRYPDLAGHWVGV